MKLRTVERHPTWKLGERLILSDTCRHHIYRVVALHGNTASARPVAASPVVEAVVAAVENVRWFLFPPSDDPFL